MSSRTATVPAPDPLEPKQQRSHETQQRLLDAAVDELVEFGYARLTTTAVARRAGVSRGAQQNHFPHKTTLVIEAVRHLLNHQLEDLSRRVGDATRGAGRTERALDVLFELYRGPLFAATVELSLVSRSEPALREVMVEHERIVGKAILSAIADLVNTGDGEPGHLWAIALNTIRGLATLGLLGHPKQGIERQWHSARPVLLQLLSGEGAMPE